MASQRASLHGKGLRHLPVPSQVSDPSEVQLLDDLVATTWKGCLGSLMAAREGLGGEDDPTQPTEGGLPLFCTWPCLSCDNSYKKLLDTGSTCCAVVALRTQQNCFTINPKGGGGPRHSPPHHLAARASAPTALFCTTDLHGKCSHKYSLHDIKRHDMAHDA
jgi:hypothetical protein